MLLKAMAGLARPECTLALCLISSTGVTLAPQQACSCGPAASLNVVVTGASLPDALAGGLNPISVGNALCLPAEGEATGQAGCRASKLGSCSAELLASEAGCVARMLLCVKR